MPVEMLRPPERERVTEGDGRRPKGAASIVDVMRMTPAQARYYLSESRYNVAACGRRSGKTAIGKRRGVRKALNWTGVADARFLFGAPTQQQAKVIFWRDLKRLVPAWAMARKPSESDLTIELVNGAIIQVMGFDRPQRAEGSPVGHAHLDEFADMDPATWTEHLRPMLTDTQGTADITGVPEGRNHYWDLWCEALADQEGEWGAHHWTTAEVLPMYLGELAAEREIRSARAALDIVTFRQEYEASFNNVEGRVYYEFDRETHARERCHYNPNRSLCLCFDFNVAPGVCAYLQEGMYKGADPSVSREATFAIGEVHIPRDSNTAMVCRRIIADWHGSGDSPPRIARHEGEVLVYGDPAGGLRSTKTEHGSDWDVIRAVLQPVFGERLKFRVKRDQPRQRARVNSLNARLRTADGVKHFLVDPINCKRLIEDLEVVTVKEGTAGEIDKDKDDGRFSHISDAVGYYMDYRHPIGGGMRSGSDSML